VLINVQFLGGLLSNLKKDTALRSSQPFIRALAYQVTIAAFDNLVLLAILYKPAALFLLCCHSRIMISDMLEGWPCRFVAHHLSVSIPTYWNPSCLARSTRNQRFNTLLRYKLWMFGDAKSLWTKMTIVALRQANGRHFKSTAYTRHTQNAMITSGSWYVALVLWVLWVY